MRKIILNSFLSLCFCVFFLFAGCETLPDSYSGTCPKPEVLAEFKIPADVPVILLPVTFDGKEYDFILDTGATHVVFDASLKDKLGKRFLWPRKGKKVGGETFKVEFFHAPRAYLGSLNLKDCMFVIVDDLEPVSSVLKTKIHGILGMNFLEDYVIQIDFDKAKILFLKGKKNTDIFSFLRPKENEHPEWGECISIKRRFLDRSPYVQADFDGHIATLMVDTGHYVQIPTPNVTGVAGILKKRTFERVCPVQSKGYGVVETLSVGSLEYKELVFKQDTPSLLGLFFLSRHMVTFDFPNNKMYLKKGKDFDRPTGLPLSLEQLDFTLCRNRGNTVVSSIDPNGLGHRKGIRQDDVLLKIENQDVSSYGLVELVEFFSQPPKEQDGVLTFTFKRGDDIINISFTNSDIASERDGTD